MRAALYTRVSVAHLGASVPDLLAELRHYAADVREWDVSLELADRGPGLTEHRPGLAALLDAIRGRRVDVVVTTSLSRLCRSLDHLVDVAGLLEAQADLEEVGLVALAEMVDTTTPDGRVRWLDAVGLLRQVRFQLRSEAIKVARVRQAVRGVDDSWGRPIAVINPLELMGYWHGSSDKRPLSVREMAKRLGYSVSTVRKHIRELLGAGRLHPEVRAANLAAVGGLRKGGRPARAKIDVDDLVASWTAGLSRKQLRKRFRCGGERLDRLLAELRSAGRLDEQQRETNVMRRRR